MTHPIGVFDSGYGGLTVLSEIMRELPEYDYLYLGDNARAPYGTRSYDTVYKYTLQSVKWLFDQGCPLVILACNTASAKALRTIQQNDLEKIAPGKRVLGVIRPTSEIVGKYTRSGHIGIFGTAGTVNSRSYIIEIGKFWPDVKVTQEACPMWVPLVENNEADKPGADYFIEQHTSRLLAADPEIDSILLACTHYPLLAGKIKAFIPEGVKLISQGDIVAKSLASYLERHPEIEGRCSRTGQRAFFTTGSIDDFEEHALGFLGTEVTARHLDLL